MDTQKNQIYISKTEGDSINMWKWNSSLLLGKPLIPSLVSLSNQKTFVCVMNFPFLLKTHATRWMSSFLDKDSFVSVSLHEI